MIIDTHTHVVSSDKVTHPLDPGARGWSTEVSNNVEDLIAEMDRAGVDCATLVQPNATYGLDNSYQCDSAKQYAPRTVAVGILDPAASDAADKLSYWVHECGMQGNADRNASLVIGQRLVMRSQKAQGKPPTPLAIERVEKSTSVIVCQDAKGEEGPSIPPARHGDDNEHGTAHAVWLGMAERIADIPHPLRS